MEKFYTLCSGFVESRTAHSTSPGSSDTGDDIHIVDVVKGTGSARGVDAAAMIVTGSIKEVGGEQSIRQFVEYAQTIIPETAYYVSVSTLRLFPTLTLSFGDILLMLESYTELMRRERQGIYRARQQCWVAAHFDRSDATRSDERWSASDSSFDVYYGCIDEIWEAEVSYLTPAEQLLYCKTFKLSRINWWYGIRLDKASQLPFTFLLGRNRRSTLRDTLRSLKYFACIKRLIGYTDHEGRRMFYDPVFDSELAGNRSKGFLRRVLGEMM
ncbi:unnamed protein product [Agarophyton chilense]